MWALQGHDPGSMDATALGMNLRLGELAAALALRQLEGLTDQLERRRAVHRRYRFGAWWATTPTERTECRASARRSRINWYGSTTRRPGATSGAPRASASETRPYYDRAIPDLTAFVGRVSSVERARDLAVRSFAIPIHPRLSDDDVDRVIEGIASFFAHHTRS